MNHLHYLRNDADISLRKLETKVNIITSTLSRLELGGRDFRQDHIDRLTEFFDCTSDFLLGKSNTGIYVHTFDGDKVLLSLEEYEKIKPEVYITVVSGFVKTSNISYQVHRELSSQITINKSPLTELLEIESKMDEEQLRKVLQFIKDYML